MKTRSFGVALLGVLLALVASTVLTMLHPGSALAASCIPNVNGKGQSAALVNPASFSGSLDATGCDFGIFVTEDHFSTITNATIAGAPTAIDVDLDGTVTVSYSTLYSSNRGIVLGDRGPGNGMISNNTIIYGAITLPCGICVQNTGSKATIMNNLIKGPGDTPQFPAGISAGAASSVKISNNTILNNTYGIRTFPPDSFGYSVSGNLVKNNAVGIEVSGGTGSVIEGNRVEIGTNDGIFDFSSFNDQIVKNFVCGSIDPLDTSAAINPIVAGNVVHATCP